MSAPLKIQIHENQASYCRFGGETLSKLLQAFEAQISGVMASNDIEYVHKMRVASRRIRAAMPLFQTCYPKKKYKKWLGEVKKVTRLLGEARDLDVQIACIQSYIKKNGPSEKDLEFLIESHQNRRKAIQGTVTDGLEKLQGAGVLLEMSEFWEQTITELAKKPFDATEVLEKAHWHISLRLDDFLGMEEFVHQEKAVRKHHEMRIKAKWLRYTMETFAPLYKKQLSSEIQTIKEFQDTLGEMHDCDVWIDYIPKFISRINAQTQRKNKTKPTQTRGLRKFLGYIKAERKNHYKHFVQFWDENKKNNFFEQVREATNAGVSSVESRIKAAAADPDVKIAVLADIHANLHALEAVIEDAEERGIKVFLNAGDLTGFGPLPNEVIELLQVKNVISVVGNFDLEVAQKENKGEKRIAVEFAKKELMHSCKAYLLSLPAEFTFEMAGKKLLMVHGSPSSIEEHIYQDTPAERLKMLAGQANADVIIVGHAHEQFYREENGAAFVNPGSVGRPGDGNPQAAYAVVSFNPFSVELLRLDYDVAAAADAMRKKGLPESFAQMLLRGVAIDVVLEEDRAKKDCMAQNCNMNTRISRKIAKGYCPETAHSNQVSKLALDFFDKLEKVHHLGVRERCWLECAAVLHDIGLSEGRVGHHKKSMKSILNDTRLPFTSQERQIVASIARYHRKGLPKPKHKNLAALSPEVVKKICLLSSLLRVADGLDYSHQAVVKRLNIKVGAKKVTVEYVCPSKSPLEEQAFNKKKDLFEKVFNKKLVLLWKQL